MLSRLAHSCEESASSRAPRRGHRALTSTIPLALTRRSGPHVAAHRAVAIGENVALENERPAEAGRSRKDRAYVAEGDRGTLRRPARTVIFCCGTISVLRGGLGVVYAVGAALAFGDKKSPRLSGGRNYR
jgi:hypothetical protein